MSKKNAGREEKKPHHIYDEAFSIIYFNFN